METSLIASNLVLWVVVVALALVVLALTRQIGVLHERIAPAGALATTRGPKVGEAAPELQVNDLDGRTHHIGPPPEGSETALSRLLFFLSPTCPVCKTLLPVIRSSAKSEQGWLQVLLASDGDPEQQQAFVAREKLEAFPYIVSTELGMTYLVEKLPYAVLIDAAGVVRAKGLVNSREHLESLFEAKEHGVASIQEYLSRQS